MFHRLIPKLPSILRQFLSEMCVCVCVVEWKTKKNGNKEMSIIGWNEVLTSLRFGFVPSLKNIYIYIYTKEAGIMLTHST